MMNMSTTNTLMTNTLVVDLSTAARATARRLGATGLLSLAATPTFGAWALLTANGSTADIMCGSASPFGSMAAMYGLMALFHVTPWLRLIGQSR